MAQRKQLTTRPFEQETLCQSTNRELIPYLRQTGSLVETAIPPTAPAVTGSRAGATVAILTRVLLILDAAGIIDDQTTP